VDDRRADTLTRLFGSRAFARLWVAQVVSALGDWLGFLAIAIVATRLGSSPEAAVAMVMAARLVPGFFLAPVAGVIVDRLPRKRVMVTCDLGRAAVVATLPFVDSVTQLVLASLLLEVFTLLWAPAKEATVPRIVPADRLTSANSLSLAAAYGTFPAASLLFALLAPLSAWLAGFDVLSPLRLGRDGSLAFYVDVGTFLLAAFLISRIDLPVRSRQERARAGRGRIDWSRTLGELKEGWHFIFLNPTVRAVNVGLAGSLVGGAMVVPLGPLFAVEVLAAGEGAFGALISALGFGGAAGVVAVNAVQQRLPRAQTFTLALFGAAVSLAAGATVGSLPWAMVAVFVLGLCAGTAYVLGFTLLHEHTDDELLGRTFGGLFTMVRFCVLFAFLAGPVLSALLGRASNRWLDSELALGGVAMALPGVRLTLWLAAVIIVGAALVAARSLRSAARRDAHHPSRLGRQEAA
jgi:MFS family permease